MNMAGLAVGMTCCILIMLWVQDEFSFDRFHKNIDNLYRVVESEEMSSGEIHSWAVVPGPLAPILKSEYPEIINTMRFKRFGSRVIQNDEKIFNENSFCFSDPSIFEMFTFPLLKGDPQTALNGPYSMVITEEIAQKYFGQEDPVGQILKVDNRFDFKITGVMHNVPVNSHLSFSFLVPFETINEFHRKIDDWETYAFAAYVLLQDGTPYLPVSKKIANVIKKHDSDAIAVLSLQPVKDIHLHSEGIHGMGGIGDVKYVYIFSLTAFFILLAACINFMNLSTARSAKRAKEISLRKVVGAGRQQIIKQFFGESLLFTFIAFLFSIALIELLLPAFNNLAAKQISIDYFQPAVFFGLLGVILITGIFSGSYPAFFLSTFKPAAMLKGSKNIKSSNAPLRKILVTVQFALTIFLLISTSVVYNQLEFIRNKKLGYNKEHLVCIPMRGKLNQKYETLRKELIQNSSIVNISAASALPSRIGHSFIASDWEANDQNKKMLVYQMSADNNFLDAFEMKMAAGRYFSKDFTADAAESVILNEVAVEAMGLQSPLGKIFHERKIIGIVKNFHFSSLHNKIAPLIITNDASDFYYCCVKIKSHDLSGTLASIENTWKSAAANFPFSYRFMDERLELLYRTEQRIGLIVKYFTYLAVLICCLGLFGLSSYAAEQRTKEIGIRKVLGASMGSVMLLLSKEFTKWVLLANIIAWPAAWMIMNCWMQGFAYKTEISWQVFVLAGCAALFIALITVSSQAYKAAVSNPAAALRYE